MPSRWELVLQPRRAGEARVTPGQLHGLACALLEKAGADHRAQTKPFSVGPLMARPDGAALLTIGWLDDARPPALDTIVRGEVRLGSQFFVVADVAVRFEPYDAYLTLPPARAATMEFVTVTYFSRGALQVPLPDPVLVYRNLARRWNHFAPFPVPDDVLADLDRNAALTSAQVETAVVNPGKGPKTGFRGVATFRVLSGATPEARAAFTALSMYADVAGVGAQAGHGLGWVRVELTADAPTVV